MGGKVLPTAFIINMGANGLGVARTLGRMGVPVVGVDDQASAPGLASKYVTPLLGENSLERPDALLETLMRSGEELEERGVIFPASDAAFLFLSHYERKLSEHFHFMMPPEPVREAMVNKRLQYEEALRLDIPLAETYFPTAPDDLKEIETGIRYPAFIKPLYSHLWYTTFSNKGFIVTSPTALREKMTKVFASGHEVMVQSIMMPTGKDLYLVGAYFGRDGYVSPDFCWHKLRQYPPNFGVGSLVQSAHQPEVSELALRFMKGIGYKGIGYVEFKKDQRDGMFKMVEMNARTELTNGLQYAAGRPLVLYQYYDLIGHSLPQMGDYPDGVRWWDSLNDIDSFWRLRRRGELTLIQWVRSFFRPDVHAYFALHDPAPLIRRYGFGIEGAKLVVDLLKMKTDQDDMVTMGWKAPSIVDPTVPPCTKDGGRNVKTHEDDFST